MVGGSGSDHGAGYGRMGNGVGFGSVGGGYSISTDSAADGRCFT